MEKIKKSTRPFGSKNISILIIVVAILIFGLGYFFYVKPASDLAAELNSQDILTLQVTLGEKQTRLFSAKKLAKSYENPSEDMIKRLNEALPSESGQIDLYVNMGNLVEQSGLTLSDIEISVPEENEIPAALQAVGVMPASKVKEIKIRLNLDGMSYTNLKRFVRNIETNSRLLRMDELTFNPTSSSYNANLTAFYLPN